VTRRIHISLAIVSTFLGAGLAHAQTTLESAIVQFDQLTQGYNLISLGNASFTQYGDTQGAVAVRGDLTLNGAGQIGEHYSAGSKPSLYVGGQLHLQSGQHTHMKLGYAYLPGTSGTWDETQRVFTTTSGGKFSTINSDHPLAGTNPTSTLDAAPFSWDSLSAGLVSVSNTLASAASTGTINVSGGNMVLSANGQTSGVVVFTLDANAFKGSIYDANGDGVFDQNNERVNNLSINVPENVVFVINVKNFGGKTLLQDINFNTGSGNERLLWNITPEDNNGTVTLGNRANFYGSVLAPLVDLKNGQNTAPNGQIVAGNYTHHGAELHQIEFIAPVAFSPVPEPATFGVFGVAATLGIAFGRRGGRRSTTA
jgi:hypothetical protein